MKDTDSLCARCARTGATCCRNTHVFLTLGDLRRISSAGHADYHEHAAPADSLRRAGVEHDAAWCLTFGRAGGRRALRHRPGGDCVFLGERGCRLEPDVRPLVCRLYPFDYNEETIKGVDAPLCPEPECDNPALLLALLGMNRDAGEEWRRMLYREIGEEFGAGIRTEKG